MGKPHGSQKKAAVARPPARGRTGVGASKALSSNWKAMLKVRLDACARLGLRSQLSLSLSVSLNLSRISRLVSPRRRPLRLGLQQRKALVLAHRQQWQQQQRRIPRPLRAKSMQKSCEFLNGVSQMGHES